MTPHLIDLPRKYDRRGSLTFIQNGGIDFDIRRVYWLYDMPAGSSREGRALSATAEIIIAVSGAFTVTIDDGLGHKQSFTLRNPWQGLFVPPMTWRTITDIAGGSRALVLASELYDAQQYIRDHSIFASAAANAPADKPLVQSTPRKVRLSKSLGHGISSVSEDARLIPLRRIRNSMGSLTAIENKAPAPFNTERVFYIYDVPTEAERGGHSHYRMHELIVALGGSFDVIVNDGRNERRFTLTRPYEALYVPCGLWRSLADFSSGAVCLAFASTPYEPRDYVRSFQLFDQLSRKHS